MVSYYSKVQQFVQEMLGHLLLRYWLIPGRTFGFLELKSVADAHYAVQELNDRLVRMCGALFQLPPQSFLFHSQINGVNLVAERSLAFTPDYNPKVMEVIADSTDLILKNLPFDYTVDQLRDDLVGC